MREMPFQDASFDGVVSVAAINHLNKEGVVGAAWLKSVRDGLAA